MNYRFLRGGHIQETNPMVPRGRLRLAAGIGCHPFIRLGRGVYHDDRGQQVRALLVERLDPQGLELEDVVHDLAGPEWAQVPLGSIDLDSHKHLSQGVLSVSAAEVAR